LIVRLNELLFSGFFNKSELLVQKPDGDTYNMSNEEGEIECVFTYNVPNSPMTTTETLFRNNF